MTVPLYLVPSFRQEGWPPPPHLVQQQGHCSSNASYSHRSHLPNANVAGKRVSLGAGTPALLHRQEGGFLNVTVATEGAVSSLLGVTGTFAPSLDHLRSKGQHRHHQQGPYGSLTHYATRRPLTYTPEQPDIYALATHGHTTDWDSLPNSRLESHRGGTAWKRIDAEFARYSLQNLRGSQSETTSSGLSLELLPTLDRGKGHQSRARLQKQLRELQAEKVDFKERVLSAESRYRESSPPSSGAFGEPQYGAGFGRSSMSDYKDARGVDTSTGSSSLVNQPDLPSWREEPSFKILRLSADPPSSRSTMPNRRGKSRTVNAGKVLVFDTTTTSFDIDARSANVGAEGIAFGKHQLDGENEEHSRENSCKRYQCLVPSCFKTFTTSGHARRHSRTHLNDNFFACPHEGCRSTFTRKDNCRQHQRTHHRKTLPILETTESESLDDFIIDQQQEENQLKEEGRQEQQASDSSARRHPYP